MQTSSFLLLLPNVSLAETETKDLKTKCNFRGKVDLHVRRIHMHIAANTENPFKFKSQNVNF